MVFESEVGSRDRADGNGDDGLEEEAEDGDNETSFEGDLDPVVYNLFSLHKGVFLQPQSLPTSVHPISHMSRQHHMIMGMFSNLSSHSLD